LFCPERVLSETPSSRLRRAAAKRSLWLVALLVPILATTLCHSQDFKLLPRNTMGGYLDFGFAPPHNEWDLNRCNANSGSPANGGVNAPCSAFARSALSGHFEIVPFSYGPLKKLLVFVEPQFFFGDNLPQVHYTESFQAIGVSVSTGLIYELPRGFEARLVSHEKMHWFGKYQGLLGPADLRGDGPYGQYNSIDVRWKFGTFNSRRVQ
jgi:hypothetical protein